MKKPYQCVVVLALLLPAGAAFAQQKADEMKGMDMGKKPLASAQAPHVAKGVVKKVDPATGTVTLAHEQVKSLNWPAMTMGFKLQDMKLLDKFTEGKTVQVELVQVGNNYLISAVK